MEKIISFNINESIEDRDIVLQLEDLCRNNVKLNIKNIEILLNNLSYLVRKKIADYEGVNINEYLYTNKCDLAQSMIYYYLRQLSINVNPINTNNVIQGVCGHSFIIASFETTEGKKLFLIDPTYIQFFSKSGCDINRFVIINDKICVTPDPGFFIVESNSEELILPLLENGYIELTEQVAMAYGNSFFKTKQGVLYDQINNNKASGSDYIKWFQYYTSTLSKTEKELEDMNLTIDLMSSKKGKNR